MVVCATLKREGTVSGCAGGSGNSPLAPTVSNPAQSSGTQSVPNETVYMSTYGSPVATQLSLYAWTAGKGDELPAGGVNGPATISPVVIAVASDSAGDVYAAYSDAEKAIVEFPPHPNGTPNPTRIIEGSHTLLGSIHALAVAPDVRSLC